MIVINKDLTLCSQIFNLLLRDGTVERIVHNMPVVLDYSNVTTPLIAVKISSMSRQFHTEVKWYRPWNPMSKALATTYTGNYRLIKLNSRRKDRSMPSLVGSIAHEWGHCFEYFFKSKFRDHYFNHGDNNPVGKDNTFQYILGRKIKAYVEEHEHELLRRLAVID